MLKTCALAFTLTLASIGAVMAQQPPANPNAPSNPAVARPGPSTPMVAPGANSFTEAQAKVRLENQGFTGISPLVKDADGVWRGMATKAGRSLNVAVDYQGNVVEK